MFSKRYKASLDALSSLQIREPDFRMSLKYLSQMVGGYPSPTIAKESLVMSTQGAL